MRLPAAAVDPPAAPDAQPIPVLAIVGPTGVGKTRLGVALAEEWPIEAVSVDSRQVYRRMDIGTAKPTAAERRALRHHLIDVVEPDEPYDTERFARQAAAAIAGIHARQRWPVLIGGTGLYFRALVRGLSRLPSADRELRWRLYAEAATGGREALHRRLAEVDPESAKRLHPHDLLRVTRALEIVTLTGRPASLARAAWPGGSASPYRILAIGLTMDREALYARLDARVDRMVAEGLLGEVEALLAAGFGVDLPAMQGIGYRHLVPVVTWGASLSEAVRTMKRDTRRYAKRQWTWFAREEVAHWVTVEPSSSARGLAEIKKAVEAARIFG